MEYRYKTVPPATCRVCSLHIHIKFHRISIWTYIYILSNIDLACMLKPVKPRGDTSVAFLSTGLYIKEPANICHGIHRQAGSSTWWQSIIDNSIWSYNHIRATALESYALFRCVESAMLVLSMPLYRQWLIQQIATLLLVTGFVKLFCLLLVWSIVHIVH